MKRVILPAVVCPKIGRAGSHLVVDDNKMLVHEIGRDEAPHFLAASKTVRENQGATRRISHYLDIVTFSNLVPSHGFGQCGPAVSAEIGFAVGLDVEGCVCL